MLNVGSIVEGGFRVIREHPAAVAVWALIYLGYSVAMMAVMRPFLVAQMEVMQSGAAAMDPAAVMGAMLPIYAFGLFNLIVMLILWCAAYRTVFRPEAGGLAFLRIGMDELRMFVVGLVFFVVAIILFIAASIIIGIVMAATMMAGGGESPTGAIIFSVAMIVVLLALTVFLQIRFAFAFPLTMHRRKIIIGEAWALSRGRFWTLFLGYLVIGIIVILLSFAVALGTMWDYWTTMLAARGDPAAMAALGEQQLAQQLTFGSMAILQMVGGAVMAVIQLAIGAGAVGWAAKLALADDDDDIEEVLA